MVCFQDGSIVARTYLELFGPPGDLIEKQVLQQFLQSLPYQQYVNMNELS